MPIPDTPWLSPSFQGRSGPSGNSHVSSIIALPKPVRAMAETKKRGRKGSGSQTRPAAKKTRSHSKNKPPEVASTLIAMDVDAAAVESESVESNTNTPEPTQNKKGRRRITLPPRDPLPPRSTRQEHPGQVDAPRPRRTSEQVAADDQAKAEAEQAQTEARAEAQRRLAEMMIQEAAARSQLDASMPTLRAETEDDSLEEEEDDEGEDGIEDIEVEEDDEDDEEDDEEEEAPVKKNRKQKAKRGQTRALVEIREQDERNTLIKQLEAQLATLKSGSEQRITNVGKTSTSSSKPQVIPTGISTSFKNKTSSRQKGSKNTAVPIGGLRDEDAAGQRPTTPVPNELVAVFEDAGMELVQPSDSSDDNCAMQRTLAAAVKKKAASTSTRTPITKQSKTSKKAPSSVKQSQSNSKNTRKAVPAPSNSSDENDKNAPPLPREIKRKWASTFLPTLCNRYFADTEPFANFRKSQEFLRIVQEVFDLVYEELEEPYEVTGNKDDAVYFHAYKRINEKQSKIGRHARDDIRAYFEGSQYKNKVSRIKKYAIWGARANGPGICATPTPENCTVGPGAKGYIPPANDGICLSTFMIAAMKPMLKSSSGAIENYGHPVGLLALCAAAITRAFKMYSASGVYSKELVGDFSEARCTDIVASFVSVAKTFSPNHWSRIYQACTTENPEDPSLEPIAEDSFHDTLASLYRPSSPIEASD
ncbi:hypothetical protein PM082_024444 [Marasmius tenuissimus]|nr:hypothetical protein PM082_024444 [Marasmius tenuissimus]